MLERKVTLSVLTEGQNIVSEDMSAPPPVPVDKFGSYVEGLHQKNNKGFKDQYMVRPGGTSGHVILEHSGVDIASACIVCHQADS